MLAPENHRLLGKRCFGRGNVVHAEPRDHCRERDQRNPDEARILQPQLFDLPALGPGLRVAAKCTKHAGRDHQRHDELHHRYAKIAEAGVHAERIALLRLRIKKTDVGHRRREVPAAQTAQ